MKTYIPAVVRQDKSWKNKAASSMPVYMRGLSFWQNMLKSDSDIPFAYAFAVGVILAAIGPLTGFISLFVAVPVLLCFIIRTAMYIRYYSRGWSVLTAYEVTAYNTYLALPEDIQKEIKPLAKAHYKDSYDEGVYTKEFLKLMNEYSEIYKNTGGRKLENLIESHRNSIKIMKELNK